jgi:serine/threonine protein kinase
VRLFCQALDGIEHAHRLGIVHRDIKPANLMMTEAGSIKVMDFGIARALGSARTTRTGMLVGTIEYMSPEQIKGLEVDARSDIYSLGILLYEMLIGRVPFESNSDYELMRAQIEEPPRPPRDLAPHIPLQIERAIMRALAKKPEARFQSAAEFRAALLSALSPSLKEAQPDGSQVPRPGPNEASLLSRIGWKHVIAAALLTFVSALSILMITGGREQASPTAEPPASAPPRPELPLQQPSPQPIRVETPLTPSRQAATEPKRMTKATAPAINPPSAPQQEAKQPKTPTKDRAAINEPKGDDEASEKKGSAAKEVIKKPVEGIKKLGGWLGFGKKKKDQSP